MILYMAVTLYLGHLFISNHGQSCTFPVMLFVYVQPPYVCKPEELYSCCILLYICWNLHSLAELPVVQSISILCPQIRTTHWNFLVAYDYCTWSSYWVKELGTCFPTQPPVSTLHIAHVTVHSSVFIVWSVFYKLATNISWAALNGTQGVQHRWVSLHSESACGHWGGTKTPC